MINLTASAPDASETWWMRNFRVDNIILILTLCGAIAAGLWQGGRIQQTLQDSVSAEAILRQAQYTQLDGQIGQVANTVNDVRQDVRELRSYMMAGHEFPASDRTSRK